MKTRAALALSVAGILVTGSAALAVNTQVLNTTPAGTGNANSVLLPNGTGRTPAPGAVASAGATPDVTPAIKGGSTTPTATSAADGPESGDRKSGSRTRPSTGPGGGRDAEAGTVAGKDDAGPAGSQSNAGDPAVVVQPRDDKGGLRTVPEPRDDKGGQRNATERGDDSGGHGSGD
ncbi:hypothetical protein [Arthrobacter sp. NPDC056727]|uniref:hypothetical protein n=1 Tax=Arthrobacter sp. NPDC056727 TaxID=3345927 RepID=UPI00366B2456